MHNAYHVWKITKILHFDYDQLAKYSAGNRTFENILFHLININQKYNLYSLFVRHKERKKKYADFSYLEITMFIVSLFPLLTCSENGLAV